MSEQTADYVDHCTGMVRLLDIRRHEMLCRLLARPDPPDLPPRRATVKYTGSADRWRIWMPRILRATRLRLMEARGWADDLSDEVRSLTQDDGAGGHREGGSDD